MKVKRQYELLQVATGEKKMSELSSPLNEEEKKYLEGLKKDVKESREKYGRVVFYIPNDYDDYDEDTDQSIYSDDFCKEYEER